MATVIPKQPKKERDQITIKLDHDALQALERYCRYLESSRDYVITQCLLFIFRKDRPFSDWLAAQGLVVCQPPNGVEAEHPVAKSANRKLKPRAGQTLLPIGD